MTKITRTSSFPVMHLHQAAGLAPVSPFPMEMRIRFPGGLAVEADLDGHTVRTDQPVAIGGGGSAPSPFDLFLASIDLPDGKPAVSPTRSSEKGSGDEQ